MDEPIHVSAADRLRLAALINNPHTPKVAVRRAEIVLLAAKGCGTSEIRWHTGRHRAVVARWQQRFRESGVDGLLDGRPWLRSAPLSILELKDQLAALTTPVPPESKRRWSRVEALRLTHWGASVVGQIWRAHGLQLRLPSKLGLSDDPDLIRKILEITSLYLNPPPGAVVVCIDEMGQIPACPREQRASGQTQVSSEFGQRTTNMFAALNVHDGRIISRCMQRQRHGELIRFLNAVNAAVLPGKKVHLVMDNFAPHLHAKVVRWLARHPRFQAHYTPTRMSWLNAVEAVFAKTSRTCLKSRKFRSIIELQIAINKFVAELNGDLRPFGIGDDFTV